MFVVRNFENINLEFIEFDEGKSHFVPFLVVYHIMNETEIWPFLRLLRMNSLKCSTEINSSRNERIE